jgi:hypothetical protein
MEQVQHKVRAYDEAVAAEAAQALAAAGKSVTEVPGESGNATDAATAAALTPEAQRELKREILARQFSPDFAVSAPSPSSSSSSSTSFRGAKLRSPPNATHGGTASRAASPTAGNGTAVHAVHAVPVVPHRPSNSNSYYNSSNNNLQQQQQQQQQQKLQHTVRQLREQHLRDHMLRRLQGLGDLPLYRAGAGDAGAFAFAGAGAGASNSSGSESIPNKNSARQLRHKL